MERYISNDFEEKLPTIVPSKCEKVIFIRGIKLNLEIWDTVDYTKFHSFMEFFYHKSHGALIVFDLFDKESFDHIDFHF